jgi:hypothetical protein
MRSSRVAQRRGASSSQRFTQKLSEFLTLFKAGLLGVLAISAREGGFSSGWLPWFEQLSRAWQMLSFVTDNTLGAVWPASVTFIDSANAFTNLRGYAGSFPSGAFTDAAFYASAAWVATLVALLGWGIFNFARDSIPFLQPLRVLRVMANLSAGVLFIPMLQLLLVIP